jgi:hypothetical protein
VGKKPKRKGAELKSIAEAHFQIMSKSFGRFGVATRLPRPVVFEMVSKRVPLFFENGFEVKDIHAMCSEGVS